MRNIYARNVKMKPPFQIYYGICKSLLVIQLFQALPKPIYFLKFIKINFNTKLGSVQIKLKKEKITPNIASFPR